MSPDVVLTAPDMCALVDRVPPSLCVYDLQTSAGHIESEDGVKPYALVGHAESEDGLKPYALVDSPVHEEQSELHSKVVLMNVG